MLVKVSWSVRVLFVSFAYGVDNIICKVAVIVDICYEALALGYRILLKIVCTYLLLTEHEVCMGLDRPVHGLV